MNNIIITGERRNRICCQLLNEIRSNIKCDIGGYFVNVTNDENNENVRIFRLTSLYDHDSDNIFFIKDDSTGISKLNIEVFNKKGVEILKKSYENRNVIVMDEIGFLESKAYDFTKQVIKVLDSEKVVIALVKGVSCKYIDSIKERDDVNTFFVDEKNMKGIKRNIFDLLIKWNVELKKY